MLYQPWRVCAARVMHHAGRVSCGVLTASVIGAGASAQPLSLNLADSFAPAKAALAQGQVADILVLGDSLSVRQGSYLPYLTADLQTVYGNAGGGYQGMSWWTGGGFNSGWVKGFINQDTPPHHTLDGLWASWEGPAGQFNSAFLTARSDHVTLYYVAQPGGGTATISLPNSSSIPLNTAAAATEMRTVSYSVPGPNKQVWFLPALNGAVKILGANNTTGLPGVVVHRGANGGWGVENFIRRDFTFEGQISSLGPELVLIWIGQNDQAYDRPTYAPRLNLMIDRVRAAAPGVPIVLIGTYDSGSPRIRPLVQAMADVAQARGLGFINIHDVAGPYAFFEYMGYLDDPVHFSEAGGQHIANLLRRAWETDGSALVLCDADVSRDTWVDLTDFFLFLNAFDAQHPVADVNGDAATDLGDFFDFFNAFDAGC